jgi:hypothetical protein
LSVWQRRHRKTKKKAEEYLTILEVGTGDLTNPYSDDVDILIFTLLAMASGDKGYELHW